MSPDLLVAHIETILKDPSFKQKVTVGGKQVIAAGGLKKATELIEMAIDIGWDHLVPAVCRISQIRDLLLRFTFNHGGNNLCLMFILSFLELSSFFIRVVANAFLVTRRRLHWENNSIRVTGYHKYQFYYYCASI